MKFLVFALCVAAVSAASIKPNSAVAVAQAAVNVAAAPANAGVAAAKFASGSDAEAPILRSESEVTAEGFNYGYETGNGISAEASGSLKKVDDKEVLVLQGAYRYKLIDGTPFELTYVADENGYQPKSDSLPVGPPIPDEIQKALDYIAAHPPQVEKAN